MMLRLAAVAVVVLAAMCINVTCIQLLFLFLLVLIIYFSTGGWEWITVLLRTIRRYLLLLNTLLHSRDTKSRPDKLSLIMSETRSSLTIKEAETLSVKIANTFYDAGYRKDDVIALLMENTIDYMLIWIGLSMIGVVTSLINHNLHGDSLKYCIDACNCKAVIFTKEKSGSIREIKDDIRVKMYCYNVYDETLDDCRDFCFLLHSISRTPPPKSLESMPSDKLLFLYTSGRTGFPKAVKIKGEKLILAALLMRYSVSNDDVFYESLPRLFSTSQFMVKCYYYTTNVWLALGNASNWTEMTKKFIVENIFEFYTSSEGGSALILNLFERKMDLKSRNLLLPNKDRNFLKAKEELGDILRGDANGEALEEGLHERNQVVSTVTKTRDLYGETMREEETNKKTVYDDIYDDSSVLSEDMLIDGEGSSHFHDVDHVMIGEDVSANDVEVLMGHVIPSTDIHVYGVDVPGTEGKARMACIYDPEGVFTNIADFTQALVGILPQYALPVFLRVRKALKGTLKLEKKTLQREGFNPRACTIGDSLYYFDSLEKCYFPLPFDKAFTVKFTPIQWKVIAN